MWKQCDGMWGNVKDVMKFFSIFLLVLFSVGAIAQTEETDVSKDPKNGQLVFRGPVTYLSLTREPSFNWLEAGIDGYTPKAKKIKNLKERLTTDNYKLVVFMGTWCSDTHDMLPKFFKVLREINYPVHQIEMYGVERKKETRSGDVKKYNIANLPTIIVLDKSGNEKGRITETVKKSVEGDLLKIVGR